MQREQPASLRNFYQTLHLREGAPRDLIEEVYWALIGRAKREEMGEPAFSRYIDDLNRSYEAISSAETPPRRAQRRRESRRGALWSRRAAAVDERDLYEKLEVDYTADAEVVQIAARVLLAENELGLRDRDWRAAIRHARDVLCDGERRNEYDRSIGLVVVEDAAETEAAGGAPADRPAVMEPEAVPSTSEPTESHVEQTDSRDVIQAAPTSNAGDKGTAVKVDAVAGSKQPLRTVVRKPSPERGPARDRAPAGERASRGSIRTAKEHGGPPPWRPIAKALSRAREEKAHQQDAANDRLLALRAEPPSAVVTEAAASAAPSPRRVERPAAEQAAAGPRLRFVSGGEAGSSISLGGEEAGDDSEGSEIILLGADAPVRIRVWRRDGNYMLQHVEGPPVAVDGETLMLPIVVLDDGDVISVGETAARFELGAAVPISG
jgi:hypothetical protein